MKHSNISIFVPHRGCPNNCSFCNQKVISGQIKSANAEDVKKAVLTAIDHNVNPKDTEIAFFGGSFTAIERTDVLSLLTAAKYFMDSYGFAGIRISTRPDAINDEILKILKEYGVRSIELGAQSMDDEVLKANDRGHTVKDVITASEKIKSAGFSLGLQMMTGLYKSSWEKDIQTAKRIIEIKPDTVRIYPTVVLKNTKLGELYIKGEYMPPDAEQSAPHVAQMMQLFSKADIKIIKVGLHASEDVEKDMIAGAYHPAFKEMCESSIFLEKILKELSNYDPKGKYEIYVADKSLSKAKGLNKRNEKTLKNKGFHCIIKGKEFMNDNEVEVVEI